MATIDYTAMAARVHAANTLWWTDLETGTRLDRNKDEMQMLVVSELSEAMEGHRKRLMDDKLPHRSMPEVELADAVIRLLDIAGAYGVEIGGGHRSIFRFTGNFAADLFGVVKTIANDRNPFHICVGYSFFRIIEMATFYNLDLWGAVEEKMAYNATRADHTREGRMAEGGKRY